MPPRSRDRRTPAQHQIPPTPHRSLQELGNREIVRAGVHAQRHRRGQHRSGLQQRGHPPQADPALHVQARGEQHTEAVQAPLVRGVLQHLHVGQLVPQDVNHERFRVRERHQLIDLQLQPGPGLLLVPELRGQRAVDVCPLPERGRPKGRKHKEGVLQGPRRLARGCLLAPLGGNACLGYAGGL